MSFACDLYYGGTPEGKPNPNYGKILMAVAGADGNLAPEEWEVIRGIGEILGVPSQALDAVKNWDYRNADLPSLLGPETANRALVYDTIRAAGGDWKYGDAEKAKAHRAAKLLGVDDSVVRQLEDIVAQEDALRKRKAQIIFPDGHRV